MEANTAEDSKHPLIPLEQIQAKIYLLRGKKVMIDSDLARMYGLEVFNLNKAVGRNRARFPDDFMFQLSDQEFRDLLFQSGIASPWGGRRSRPFAFTESGIAMLSGVLKTPRAVSVHIQIIRSFVKLRELIHTNHEIAGRVRALEAQSDSHSRAILEIIGELEKQNELPAKQRIGF